MNVFEIKNNDDKSRICDMILRQLPEWFGNETAILDYTQKVQHMTFYGANDLEKTIGFVAIKSHNKFTAEIIVMGILKEYQRQGIGSLLVKTVESFCRENNYQYLTVKTLDESANYEPYDKTRKFYEKSGFIPLEVFPLFWDKDNPCLFLVKSL